MLNPVGSRPHHLSFGVLVLVPELHGDAVFIKGEQLLTETVAKLALPFGGQECNDSGFAAEEGGAITPDTIWGIGFGNCLGVSRGRGSARMGCEGKETRCTEGTLTACSRALEQL